MAAPYLQPYACPMCAALTTPHDYNSVRYSTPACFLVNNVKCVLHSISASAGFFRILTNITINYLTAVLTGLKCRQTSLPHPSTVNPRGALVLVHI